LEVNDQYIKIAKIKGQDLPWHNHEQEDELFYIVAGNLLMEIENELPFTMKKVILCKKESIIGFQPKNVLSCSLNPTEHTGKVKSATKTIEDQKY
jgi:mannose-6-phosphate isomerase-like protein (cupin superfamily)